MIITGIAGSGKSYVIDAIKCLLKQQCRICSFVGIAAFNVSGTTLHCLLQLPVRGKNGLRFGKITRKFKWSEIFNY